MTGLVPQNLAAQVESKSDYSFLVYINGHPYSKDATLPPPCFPVMASFYHSHYDVTRIRMEYPIDPSKFFMFPLYGETRMEFHEGVLRDGDRPYMDWVAEDDAGNQYGRIRMIINAPKNPDENDCDFEGS